MPKIKSNLIFFLIFLSSIWGAFVINNLFSNQQSGETLGITDCDPFNTYDQFCVTYFYQKDDENYLKEELSVAPFNESWQSSGPWGDSGPTQDYYVSGKGWFLFNQGSYILNVSSKDEVRFFIQSSSENFGTEPLINLNNSSEQIKLNFQDSGYYLLSFSYKNNNQNSDLNISWEAEDTTNQRDPQLSLPFAKGETWYFSGGPHERTLGKVGTGTSCVQTCCRYQYGICTDYCFSSSNRACYNSYYSWNSLDFAEFVGLRRRIYAEFYGYAEKQVYEGNETLIVRYDNGEIDDYRGLSLEDFNERLKLNYEIRVVPDELLAKKKSSNEVVAAREGVISSISNSSIVIDNPGGWRTEYLHLNTSSRGEGVEVGQEVERGQYLARYLVCDYMSINCNHVHLALYKKIDPNDPNSEYQNVEIVNYKIGQYDVEYNNDPPRMYDGCLIKETERNCNDYYDKLVVQPIVSNLEKNIDELEEVEISGGKSRDSLEEGEETLLDGLTLNSNISVEEVSQGDVVTINLSVINKFAYELKDVSLQVAVPQGMSYVDNSFLINNQNIEEDDIRIDLANSEEASGSGMISLDIQDIKSQSSATIVYSLELVDDKIGASVSVISTIFADEEIEKEIRNDLLINSESRSAPVAGTGMTIIILAILGGMLGVLIYLYIKSRKTAGKLK